MTHKDIFCTDSLDQLSFAFAAQYDGSGQWADTYRVNQSLLYVALPVQQQIGKSYTAKW